jgi:transcriptional regulator with XRE-family HTH domain
MTAIERRLVTATRRATDQLVRTGRECRQSRIAHGLSQAEVGRAVGLSASRISLIERGRVASVPLVTLSRIAAVVGLDLACRAYPGGQPLRDAAHLALLGKLRSVLGGGLTWRSEVPIRRAGDQRAWDATIESDADRTGVEGETRATDLQLVERRLSLKKRDDDVDAVILLLADTRWNRQVVREHQALIDASFPVTRDVCLRRLGAGMGPGGDAILLL